MEPVVLVLGNEICGWGVCRDALYQYDERAGKNMQRELECR